LETLVIVRHTTIARWNEHKDVKEDKERQPVYSVEFFCSTSVQVL
jgi:hypothetical protein